MKLPQKISKATISVKKIQSVKSVVRSLFCIFWEICILFICILSFIRLTGKETVESSEIRRGTGVW